MNPAASNPIEYDDNAVYPLVLLGGGHSHALWLKQWHKFWLQLPNTHELKRIRPLLISENTLSPYSGMLPGLITSEYDVDDCHIDLINLCQSSGCDFLQARCINLSKVDEHLYRLDFEANEPDKQLSIYCESLSINIGSQPLSDIENPGKNLTWQVKPISRFFDQWQVLQRALQEQSIQPTANSHKTTISIVGAGAAGIEIACAIKVACDTQATSDKKTAPKNCHVQIESHSPAPLPQFNSRIQKLCLQRLKSMGIEFIHTHHEFKSSADVRIFCTQSTAPPWLKKTDLVLSEQGFITVDKNLQSSLAGIFAAGDCIHFTPQPLAKAGVYAVRQADTLFHNTCVHLMNKLLNPNKLINSDKLLDSSRLLKANKTLQAFKPQNHFLSIINMGNQYALAQRGRWSAHGYWFWRYKHHIDKKFMQQFIN